METHRLHEAVDAAVDCARYLNKYVDDKAPWALAKSGDQSLKQVVRSMLFLLRSAEGMVRPFVPHAADAIAAQLGLSPLTSWDEVGRETSLPAGAKINEPVPMFPRLETKVQTKTSAPQRQENKKVTEEKTESAHIEFSDFMKVQLRVARIVEAEPVESSDKLIKLQVKIGEEKRQILAGIKQKYAATDLIGRQVVVVTNLKPRKMMGMESQGMVLAADDADGQAILLEPEHEAPEGANVH